MRRIRQVIEEDTKDIQSLIKTVEYLRETIQKMILKQHQQSILIERMSEIISKMQK